MPIGDLSALALAIPDEYKPLAAIGIGAFVLVCLMFFHGLGTHRILVQRQRGEQRLLSGKHHLFAIALLFEWAVFLMLVLHLVEIEVWALTLQCLGLIPRAQDAFFFCANAYTTVGYGVVDLEPHWRNISPMISISGLFTFAWTTSSLVNVVGAHARLLEEREAEE